MVRVNTILSHAIASVALVAAVPAMAPAPVGLPVSVAFTSIDNIRQLPQTSLFVLPSRHPAAVPSQMQRQPANPRRVAPQSCYKMSQFLPEPLLT